MIPINLTQEQIDLVELLSGKVPFEEGEWRYIPYAFVKNGKTWKLCTLEMMPESVKDEILKQRNYIIGHDPY